MSEPWLPPEHGNAQPGLRRQVARGLTWTIVNTWGEQALNLVVFIVLARLLTPVDFGLVALAAVFVAFAQLFVDQGLGDALVQRRELTGIHIDTAFWVAMATGALLTVAGILLAYPIGALLGEPDLVPILQALSLTFVFVAMSSIQMALLRRALAFRSLAIRAIVAAFVGGVVGIALALAGAGAWALVGQQLAAAIASVVALWRVSPWRPSFRVSGPHFRELFSFGVHIVGSDVLAFVSRNTDNLLIGVFLGPEALGLYTIGYRLLSVSQVMLVNVARKIAFPAFATLQDDPDRMRRAYFRLTRAAGAVILPGYIGLALVAPELTVLVFGGQWQQSGEVAAILFLIGPVLTVQAFSAAMLNAAGHPDVVLRFRLVTAVANVIGFALAVSFGIIAVAAAFVVRGYLLLPLNLSWMRRYAGIPIRGYLAQLSSIAVCTVLMAAAMLGLRVALDSAFPSLGNLAFLVGEALIGAATFLVAMWFIDRRLLGEVGVVVAQAFPGGESVQRRLQGRGGRREAETEATAADLEDL